MAVIDIPVFERTEIDASPLLDLLDAYGIVRFTINETGKQFSLYDKDNKRRVINVSQGVQKRLTRKERKERAGEMEVSANHTFDKANDTEGQFPYSGPIAYYAFLRQDEEDISLDEIKNGVPFEENTGKTVEK